MSETDAAHGYRQLQSTAKDYDLAHSFYSGERGEVFASPKLQRILRKTGERYRVNVIKSVVNGVADSLELLSVTCKDSTANERLQAIRKDNDLLLEESAFTRRASEYGDYYAIVWEDDDNPSGVVVNGIAPTSGRMVYDIDNPRKKLFFFHSWRVKPTDGSAEVWRANLLYPDRIERWETRPGSKPQDVGSWVVRNQLDDDGLPIADSWTEAHDYDTVPVFHFRNDTPYGKPEHYDGYGAQDALNKIVISHLSTIDFHVFPQRYAIEDADNLDDDLDLDDDFDTDEGDSDSPQTSGSRGLESGPGIMQWLRNVKEVGQFDPADMSGFMDSATFYLGIMAQTTSTPMDQLDPGGDEPSGESRRRKDRARVDKVKDRQKRYAPTWAALYTFALEVAGFGGDREVEVVYAPAEVVTDSEGWGTVKAKIEAGVPVRQALIETGYAESLVEEWFPEGEENTLRVADLEAVSRILRDLGTAVALNIVSAEEARAMIPEGVLPEGAPAPVPVDRPDGG